MAKKKTEPRKPSVVKALSVPLQSLRVITKSVTNTLVSAAQAFSNATSTEDRTSLTSEKRQSYQQTDFSALYSYVETESETLGLVSQANAEIFNNIEPYYVNKRLNRRNRDLRDEDEWVRNEVKFKKIDPNTLDHSDYEHEHGQFSHRKNMKTNLLNFWQNHISWKGMTFREKLAWPFVLILLLSFFLGSLYAAGFTFYLLYQKFYGFGSVEYLRNHVDVNVLFENEM